MTNLTVKDVQFIPLLLLAPVFYLISRVLSWQEEENFESDLLPDMNQSVKLDAEIQRPTEQLATQIY